MQGSQRQKILLLGSSVLPIEQKKIKKKKKKKAKNFKNKNIRKSPQNGLDGWEPVTIEVKREKEGST